ncbi:MAG: hypothetical protein HKN77_00735 [Woeseiaceae bacterium]|nr:hypothetical protein [Woeseiaceae bacterium]
MTACQHATLAGQDSKSTPACEGRHITAENYIPGSYKKFFASQLQRLEELGIDISGRPISHLAYRTETYDDYLAVRNRIEKCCRANVENVWNSRPISKLLLTEPLELGAGFSTELIELIPPAHQDQYRMGYEHVGVVIGDTVDDFCQHHRAALSGQQHQSAVCEPYFTRFDDLTMVKFYRYSLLEVCIREGQVFDGFYHVKDW